MIHGVKNNYMKIKILIIITLAACFFNFHQKTEKDVKLLEAIKIDPKLEKILDKHIKVMRLNGIFSKENNYIWLTILPQMELSDDTLKNFVNTYYHQENFSNIKTYKSYRINILTENSNSFNLDYLTASYKNKFYYNFKNRNIIIVSDLPITFDNNGTYKIMPIGTEHPKSKFLVKTFYELSWNYAAQIKGQIIE